jgi:hypothetical protein
MSSIRLSSPVVAVVLEQGPELVELEVQTDNRDAIQWDVSRGKRDWPKSTEAPMLWLSFLAWHALRRTGATQLTLDEFLKVAVQVRTVKADGSGEPATADEELVGPTQPAVAPA